MFLYHVQTTLLLITPSNDDEPFMVYDHAGDYGDGPWYGKLWNAENLATTYPRHFKPVQPVSLSVDLISVRPSKIIELCIIDVNLRKPTFNI